MSWFKRKTAEEEKIPTQDNGRPAAITHYPGDAWEGPLAYTTDPHIGRPGFYALTDDGDQLCTPHIMLTFVDGAPGNDEDGSGHWIVADDPSTTPYFSHMPPALNPPRIVPLEADVQGSSHVTGDTHASG